MRTNMRRILGVLLACMLLLLPVMEAAASSYDPAAGNVPGELFPGESLSGIVPGTLTVDGTPADTPDGTWTNNENGKVYSVTADEAGNYALAVMGYTLTVKQGTSAGSSGSEVHRTGSSGEGSDGAADVACYNSGDQVVIKAAEPAEGMQFSGWTVESPASGFSIDDPSLSEQTITMPESTDGVVIAAQYAETGGQAADTQSAESQVTDVQPAVYTLTVNNGSGSGEYAAGTMVSVTANDRSGEGLQFAGWEVENWWSVSLSDTTSGTIQFAMPAENTTLTATYTQVPTAPAGDSFQNPDNGSSQGLDIEIIQGPGNVISQDLYGGVLSAEESLTGLQEDGSDSLELQIEGQEPMPLDEAEYLLTVENSQGTAEYAAGTTVVVEADDRSAEGLVFAGWSTDSVNLVLEDFSQPVVSFTMPAESVTLIASYARAATQEMYQVSVEHGTGSGEYEPGTTVVISAEDRSGEGLTFDGWAVTSLNAEVEDLGAAETAFVMPAADVMISAGYESANGMLPAEDTGSQSETSQTEQSETSQTEGQTDQSETSPAETETEAPTETQVYKLTVENGEGSGEYAAGSIVAIEAKELDGMTFAGWVSYNDKAVIGDPSKMVTTLIMPAEDVTVAADYVTAQYRVVLDYGNGNLTESTHAPGETVTVTALDRENENLEFDHWTGTQVVAGTPVALPFADPNSAVTTFVMPEGEVTVSASYKPVLPTYHVTVSNGLINGSYEEMDCLEGDTITVAANPGPEGQKFSRWEVNDGELDLGEQANNNSITVSVTEDMDFLAVYEGIKYKVKVNDGTSDYRKCTQGTTVTLQADDAQEGMIFDHWEVDEGSAVLADTSQSETTFVMPAEDVEVSAYYRRVQYQLAVENGTSDAEYYYMGDTVTVSSSYPASGRVFDEWVSDGGNVKFADSSRSRTTFTMPASNVVARATYADGPSPDGNAILNVQQGGQYYTGDTIEFTASGTGMDNTNPNPGDYRYRPASYQIGNVTGTWQGDPYTASMAINAAGEYTLKVIYNKDVYDGSEWITDGTVDTKSVTFRVDSGRTSVETGDETPIELVAGVLLGSGLVFIILLVLFLRRRRSR